MLSELDNYLQRIEDLRGQVRALIADLPTEALNWRPIEETFPKALSFREGATNSLAVLATHVAGGEHFWIAEVIGGRPSTRDRDAEFAVKSAVKYFSIHRAGPASAETGLDAEAGPLAVGCRPAYWPAGR